MEIEALNYRLTVCKVSDVKDIDLKCGFCFVGVTGDEVSLVCKTDKTPQGTTAREDGWRGFRIKGELDFSLIGILGKIAGILADEKISIFAVSTYNTDYILVKEECFEKALTALERNGIKIIRT
ncbi:MAG: ACT domain-containing protein [Ruminococcus sp.]|nr:ACT domain-containing protein [Ruminococcus sp.]